MLRSSLSKKCFLVPLKRRLIVGGFSTMDTKRIRCRYIKFPKPSKPKDVHFKIMTYVFPCKEFFCNLKFSIALSECTFCKSEIKTVGHLFFSCNVSHVWWEHFHSWISSHNPDSAALVYIISHLVS